MSRFSVNELFILLVLGALVAITSLVVTWKIAEAETAQPREARAELQESGDASHPPG